MIFSNLNDLICLICSVYLKVTINTHLHMTFHFILSIIEKYQNQMNDVCNLLHKINTILIFTKKNIEYYHILTKTYKKKDIHTIIYNIDN